ncbi:YbaY family lipoprotein [Isoptericola sp. AK164]|uniref:YbaY family lipoprotein n=1 Tax=Isoptericola sp. AK164 TaxID=3024246 RepID=UPI0024189151|nr:YbaY family lipoprotein [Isoptericola sp. AK164]
MRVHARVFAADGAVPTPGASVTVRVLDVSRADASSVRLAETSRDVDAVDGPDGGVVVDLDLTAPDPRADCAVAAHVDVDGSGDVTPGDLVTVQHVGLDLGADEQTLDVPVRRVAG